MSLFGQQSSVSSTTGTSGTLTFSSPAIAPNGIVVLIVTDGALAEILAPTDNFGNTYTKFIDKTNASALSCSVWYTSNTLGGVTTVTANFNSSQTFKAVAIEVTGGALTDNSSSSAVNSANPAPGSITTGVPDTIVFALLRSSGTIDAGGTPTGYTTISQDDSPAKDFRYKELTAIGAENPTWTLSASAPHAVIVASFKASVIYTANSYPGPVIRMPVNTKTPWQLWAPVLAPPFPPPPPAPVEGPKLPLPFYLNPVAFKLPLNPPPVIFHGTHPPPIVIGPYVPLPPIQFPPTHLSRIVPLMTPWGFPGPDAPTTSQGVSPDLPWFPRAPKPSDPTYERRMAMLTEKLSDCLNSLLRGGYLVQDLDGTWHIEKATTIG